jgi:diguanylate cyclase (GGDEF)-like protein
MQEGNDQAGHPLEPLTAGRSERIELETRIVRPDGEATWALVLASAVRGGDDELLHLVAQVHDIDDRKRAEELLRAHADRDALTGVPNRRRLEEELTRQLAVARRHGTRGALLVMDIDRLKQINDSFGHAAGDRAIRQVATLIGHRLRGADMLARLGGDEFAVMLIGCDAAEGRKVGEHFVRLVGEHPLLIGDEKVELSLSVGVAAFDGREQSIEVLFEAADRAMYEAKRLGRSRQRRSEPARSSAAAT